MDVKEAVQTAKQHIMDLFSDEGITKVGLEEVAESQHLNHWQITIGFSRTWDHGFASAINGPPRHYKVVEINKDSGRVVSVKHRSFQITE